MHTLKDAKFLVFLHLNIGAIEKIKTYKILHGIYDSAVSPVLPVCQHSVIRGNNYRLVKNFSRYDIHQHIFTQRIIIGDPISYRIADYCNDLTLNVRSLEPDVEVCVRIDLNLVLLKR